jgi:membrane protein implicated in regulation of membrane protease activity
MNKGLLIIAIPAIVISIFWLTLGWGWHTAIIGGLLEVAIVVALGIYTMRRNGASANPEPRDTSVNH